MKILYGVVSEEEKRQVRPVVFNNTITSMKIVVEQVGVWKLEDTIAAKEAFEMIKLCDEAAVIDLRLGNAVKALWADPGLQKVWDRR
eukprot:8747-Heterococcus_DN1.PRE.1